MCIHLSSTLYRGGFSFPAETPEPLQPGETVTYDFKITMLAGSNPTVNHAFVIDATEEQKEASLSSSGLNTK